MRAVSEERNTPDPDVLEVTIVPDGTGVAE
jgi:hypothetical protein